MSSSPAPVVLRPAPFRLAADVQAGMWTGRYLESILSMTKDKETHVETISQSVVLRRMPDQGSLRLTSNPGQATLKISVPKVALPYAAEAHPEEAYRDIVAIAHDAVSARQARSEESERAGSAAAALAPIIVALVRQRHPRPAPAGAVRADPVLYLVGPTPATPARMSLLDEIFEIPDELWRSQGLIEAWSVKGIGGSVHELTLSGLNARGYVHDARDPAALLRAAVAPGMDVLLDAVSERFDAAFDAFHGGHLAI